MYEYPAIVRKVHDGDTIRADIDLGFSTWIHWESLRLFGINAPELGTPEGNVSQAWLATLLPLGTNITVRTEQDRQEKYGRYLATLLLIQPDGTLLDVNAESVRLGHAVPYSGGPRTITTTTRTRHGVTVRTHQA